MKMTPIGLDLFVSFCRKYNSPRHWEIILINFIMSLQMVDFLAALCIHQRCDCGLLFLFEKMRCSN